jgi:nucleoid DNA-binding protein
MPQTPAIKRSVFRKRGILDEKRFYRLLSEQCNYMEEENVKMFYLGLVRYIVKELREQGMVRLPHLGDLDLVRRHARRGLIGKDKNGKASVGILPETKALRFHQIYRWNEYFTKMRREHKM